MEYRILESILVVRKSIISRHTVQSIIFPLYLEKLNPHQGSYSASCKEASFPTPSFIFRTFIQKQNVGVPHVL